ncbi:MAG TPA: hypothetical protein VGU23_09590, partial [Acidobacteriaceae bacterium]|nr:hypothetical protein [Acidobacteriaceae bacterium]
QRPRMMLRKYYLFAVLLTLPTLYAQTATPPATNTWTTITSENSGVSITLPAGTTYRFGDYTHNRWSAPVKVSVATTFSPVYFPAGQFPFSDPDPYTAKELDVLQTTAPQSISVTNTSASPATAVAQIVPPLTPPTTVPVLPGTSYTLTFSNFSTPPGTGVNALMLAFVNAPANLANHTWEGTQMNLTIDGVTLVCTYGQTYSDGVFSLSCTVPGAAGSSTGSSSPGQ